MAQRLTPRGGQALLLATLSLFMMFGLMGLAIDLGWSYFRRQVAQSAADSAALASAVVASNASTTISCGQHNVVCQTATPCPSNIVSPANNIQNGCLYAKANGFLNTGNQTVVMTSSANGGTIDPTTFATLYTVTASVSETIPQLFSALQGHTMGQVSASATAQVVQLPLPYCVYALNRTAADAIVLSGSTSTINAPDCGIVDDSSSTTALDVNGNATIVAGFVKVVGSYILGGQSTISPTPHTGVGYVADPLANLAVPTAPSHCDFNGAVNYSNQGTVATMAAGTYCGKVTISGQNAHITMQPGYYCGGIDIEGQSNVVMNSGIYYICGGGFAIKSAGTVVTGTNVLVFNSDSHGIGSASYYPFLLTGQPNVTLSAPSTGTYAGVLFFKDPNVTSTNGDETINGQTQPTLTGTLYFPGAKLLLSGGVSTGPNNPAIIADTITVNGGASIQTGNGSLSQFKFTALTQ